MEINRQIYNEFEDEIIAEIDVEITLLSDKSCFLDLVEFIRKENLYLVLTNRNLTDIYEKICSKKHILDLLFNLSIRLNILSGKYSLDAETDILDVLKANIADAFSSLWGLENKEYQPIADTLHIEQTVYDKNNISTLLDSEPWILSLCVLHLYLAKTSNYQENITKSDSL